MDEDWNYKTELTDVTIDVKDSTGKVQVLERLEPNQAKRMLGVFLAADWNNATQVKEM